jgi:hypothetical protein
MFIENENINKVFGAFVVVVVGKPLSTSKYS